MEEYADLINDINKARELEEVDNYIFDQTHGKSR